MSTFPGIQQNLTDLAADMVLVADGLDALAVRIAAISAGGVMTQEELDSLSAQVADARTTAQNAAARIGTM